VDDPDYEVTDMRAHPLPSAIPGRTQPAHPGTLLSRSFRLALAAGPILIVLLVLVSVWLPWHTQPHLSTTVVPPPTFPAMATPVGAPTPLPITRALAPPPTNCPAAPPLTTVTVPAFGGFSGGTVQLAGHAPVWMVAAFYPLPTGVVDLSEPTPPSSANPEWPVLPIIWAFGPNAYPPVTVQVHDLESGTLAWWGADASGPELPILTLNSPAGSPSTHGYVGGDAPVLLFITRAGCYKMDVTWPDGSWSLVFAAGSGSS
jgi:hypothetical protein